jgi:hypothetical protein
MRGLKIGSGRGTWAKPPKTMDISFASTTKYDISRAVLTSKDVELIVSLK